jgi:hypothetical protein
VAEYIWLTRECVCGCCCWATGCDCWGRGATCFGGSTGVWGEGLLGASKSNISMLSVFWTDFDTGGDVIAVLLTDLLFVGGEIGTALISPGFFSFGAYFSNALGATVSSSLFCSGFYLFSFLYFSFSFSFSLSLFKFSFE